MVLISETLWGIGGVLLWVREWARAGGRLKFTTRVPAAKKQKPAEAGFAQAYGQAPRMAQVHPMCNPPLTEKSAPVQ